MRKKTKRQRQKAVNKAKLKYQKKATKTYCVRLFRPKDDAEISFMDEVDNRSAFIREAVRKAVEQGDWESVAYERFDRYEIMVASVEIPLAEYDDGDGDEIIAKKSAEAILWSGEAIYSSESRKCAMAEFSKRERQRSSIILSSTIKSVAYALCGAFDGGRKTIAIKPPKKPKI